MEYVESPYKDCPDRTSTCHNDCYDYRRYSRYRECLRSSNIKQSRESRLGKKIKYRGYEHYIKQQKHWN